MATTFVMKRSGINPWWAFPADPAAFFSEEEIAKAKRYVTPLRRLGMAQKLFILAVDIVVVRTHLAPWLLRELDISNWIQRLIITVLLISIVGILEGAAFTAYVELNYDK